MKGFKLCATNMNAAPGSAAVVDILVEKIVLMSPFQVKFNSWVF